ncbi:uncharacterized protein ACA1_176750 [Acanthamoeba castellanii str. Neff]|uniref:Uncharacterized protein n=1 Tax=Acanthamoeba castellanii (strain ATCC 30010 / Neff) TaxID=1257118 RepID=L8GT99_ACACF|nr:uncharacterized protein ACA1_176750 [Acanthamoeba castellanii str. Neff]ELR16117.1 hypothetical protein ACA1_176750 [Acanthamoeba castellanii str. Neff]
MFQSTYTTHQSYEIPFLLLRRAALERLAEETKRLATNSQRLAEFNADLSMTSAQSRASLRNLHDIHRAPK